ncbi:MAG: class I SAM-dependent methyltransferase [Brooklawnia sp.]
MNRFDALASSWDADPEKAERARRVARAIIERTQPGGHWLDYGAGTGALGLSLLGHAEQLTLADSSLGMLATAGQKIAVAGLADRVQTLELDLGANGTTDQRFDGAVSLLVLHHIDDVERAVARLAGLLRPGGWLALSDLEDEDGSFHGDHAPHAHHHGFDRERVADWVRRAGLVDVDLTTPYALHKNGRAYPLFLVMGRLPAA